MFHSTRLKLTTWYLLIIMIVSVTFSFIIYNVLMHEVERFDQVQRSRISRRLQQDNVFISGVSPGVPIAIPFYDPQIVEDIRNRIVSELAFVNIGILILSGGLGYLLAGRTLKPIKVMMDEQNRFVSDASHEFRTPLTSLKTSFEVYLRSHAHTTKETRTLIEESITEVNKLDTLSASLLHLAHAENLQEKLLVPVRLRDAVQTSCQTLRQLAKTKGVVVKTKLDPKLVLLGIQSEYVQLFTILLENAIKYSSPRSQVSITSWREDGTAVIDITDHGIGISEQDIPHIFGRFFRADTARSSMHTTGYGLGLSIADKLATSYKGTIHVKSELDKGSTFTVRLPVQPVFRKQD